MRHPLPLVSAILLLTQMQPGLLGQNVAVDEGAFRLSINGETVGREEFSIRRAGSGAQSRVVLRGTVRLSLPEGDRNLAPLLQAEGVGLSVTRYELKVSGEESSEIYVERSDGRYLAKVISVEGEQLREFRAGPGTVLMDDEVAHQHYLLSSFLDEGSAVSLTILSPRRGRQLRMTLTDLGQEEIRVGAALFGARHYRLEGSAGSREIWFDDEGRVLRVEFPALGYVADREGLP